MFEAIEPVAARVMPIRYDYVNGIVLAAHRY